MSLIHIRHDPPQRPLFFLSGASCTYAFGVQESGLLCHLHWGGPVRPDPALAARLDVERACFSPEFPCPAVAGGKAGHDVLRYECPTANTGDFREPMVDVRHADGTEGLRLLYAGHRVVPGKPALLDLPAVYVEAADEAETLEVDLRDARDSSGVTVTLSYTVFAGRNVIARSCRIHNHGPEPCTILRALSAAVDVPAAGQDLLTLPGAWGRERWVERAPLRAGLQAVGSRRGTSSHQSHPFFALLTAGATETAGEVRAFHLVYSGSHFGGVELDPFGVGRMVLGIHPDGFSWHLGPGETFCTPEVILNFSAEGLGGLSREFHRLYRERLVRGPWRDRERPILINNWEATTFRFDEEKLAAIARAAGPLGIELFVLDDGWFGQRGNDRSSLGDWTVHRGKLPSGLAALSETFRAHGMAFGLWFEPEMVSPDSDLYRAHPDWCLHVAGRGRTESRNQLVLDFSRPEVVDSVYAQIAAVLRSAPVQYLKWDMNRHLTEVGSAAWPAAQQGEIRHRFVLGVYAFAERLGREFPEILIEGCSGGGGRYDPGMLYYAPQHWCSDNSDPIGRLRIQHGTSLLYPPGTLCAHVAPIPTHQGRRSPSMLTRGHVALAGQFGFQTDLSRLSEDELRDAAALVEMAKQSRHLLRFGDLHRLRDPQAGNVGAWMVVAPDGAEAVVTAVLTLAEPHWRLAPLRLRGLDPAARYRSISGPAGEWPGDVLQEVGLPLDFLVNDFQSVRWHLRRVG